jgi:hypothetical protein
MTQVTHRRSPDEPEGGWLSPAGPNGWPDLEVLNLKQIEDLRSTEPDTFRRLYENQWPVDKLEPGRIPAPWES